MRRRFEFDAVLREIFRNRQTVLLKMLTRGVAVKEILDADLPKLVQRRADLVLLLADGTILHIEFQARNQRNMAFRMAAYHVLLVERYGRAIRHVVIYVGKARMQMARRVDTGSMQFGYELMDVRDISAETFLSGGPSDYAMAILAGNAEQHLPAIVRAIGDLSPQERSQAWDRLAILSGLRRLEGRLEMELKRMSTGYDVSHIPFYSEILEKGETKGRRAVLLEQLAVKFGQVPKWAETRISKAPTRDLQRWTKGVLTADSLQGVIGTRIPKE